MHVFDCSSEEVVVHEYATYCLMHLSNDFTSKIAIYEQGTLESLIRLLNSTDPDVQKNSIDTIALMLQVFQIIIHVLIFNL